MIVIKPLPKAKYAGFLLQFSYQTDHCYEPLVSESESLFSVTLTKTSLLSTLTRSFEDVLYPDYLEHPVAYGAFDNETLMGVLELNHEPWNQRLRISELLIFPEFRKLGIGTLLMNHAKEILDQSSSRMLILETQNINTPAISFYIKQGFVWTGFDLSCYSNFDIENKDVRLEFGFKKRT